MRNHWDLWRGVSYEAAVRFFFPAALVSQRFCCPPTSTSISIHKITIRLNDSPFARLLQSKGGDAHCSMISSGRPSNGGGVSRTRGAFSMLDRRASAGAEASSMALLRYRWAALDAKWHVRDDLEKLAASLEEEWKTTVQPQ